MSKKTAIIGMTGGQFLSVINDNDTELYIGVNELNVESYGAVHNGVTDDTYAIQLAINTCANASGWTVKFPSGTYIISDNISVPSNVNVRGEGQAVTIIKCIENNKKGFVFDSTHNASISSMTITAPTKTGVNGIEIANNYCSYIGIRNVNFEFLSKGICIGNGALNMVVEGCKFSYNADYSFEILPESWTNSMQITRCCFEQTTGGHFKVNSINSMIGNFHFQDCVFESCDAQYAVLLETNVSTATFEKCHFENNGGANTSIYDLYFGIGVRAIIVKNCSFSGCGLREGITVYGIYCAEQSSMITMIGNYFSCLQPNDRAIYVEEGVTGVVLINNEYGQNDIRGNDLRVVTLSPVTRIGELSAYIATGKSSSDNIAFKRTTDATPTKLFEWTKLENKSLSYITVDVLAVSDDGAKQAAYTRKALVKFESGVGISIIGTDADTTIESTSSWDCAITVSDITNGSIEVTVTGEAATNIAWTANYKFILKKWDV
jgi:hypothetical protein